MKLLVLALMAAACGTNGDSRHDVMACDGSWQSLGTLQGVGSAGCERACLTVPPNYSNSAAPKCMVGSAATVSQCSYFDSGGVKGCCEIQIPQATTPIAFFECAPQP